MVSRTRGRACWLELLDDPNAPGLDAVVNPRARFRPLDPAALAARGAKPVRAWSIEIDDANEPQLESPWARAPRACSIASFAFRDGPLPA